MRGFEMWHPARLACAGNVQLGVRRTTRKAQTARPQKRDQFQMPKMKANMNNSSGGFLKWGDSQNGWFYSWSIPLKWMM